MIVIRKLSQLRSAGREANLKTRNATLPAFCGFLVTLSIGAPNRLVEQATPGHLLLPQSQSSTSEAPRPSPVAKPKPPEVPPRKTLDGPWKLNMDESDDPKTKDQDSRGTRAGN